MVAFRLNSFIISVTATIYAWIDYANNTFQISVCGGFYDVIKGETNKDVIDRKYSYYLIFKTFYSIPFSIFSSFIVINLTNRSIVNLIDYILRHRKRSGLSYLSELFTKINDSFCCNFLNVDDENEIIFSQCDIDYVRNLLNKKGEQFSKKHLKRLNKYQYTTVEKKNFVTKVISIVKRIFKWDSNFRFSSRVINTFVVSFVALYYFLISITYQISYYVITLANYIPNSVDNTIPIGNILCSISSDTLCGDSLSNLTIKIPLPDKIFQVLPWLHDSIVWVFMAPLILSPIICLFQIYLLSNDIKTNLKQLYKGECDFVRKAINIGNAAIARGSFHFGGYKNFHLLHDKELIYLENFFEFLQTYKCLVV